MIELNKNIRYRSEGADKIVIPPDLLKELLGYSLINQKNMQNIIIHNLYPFTKCKIISDTNVVSFVYFEVLDDHHILLIMDTLANKPDNWMAAIIDTNTVSFYRINNESYLQIGVGKLKGFKKDRTVIEDVEDQQIGEFLIQRFTLVLTIFDHINNISLNEPELETKAVKTNKKKGKKRGGNKIKYISTRKYILTGTEKKSKAQNAARLHP